MEKLELLLEVGTEEIPARMVKAAAEDLSKLLTGALAEKRLSFTASGARTFWTPRRLAVFVPDLAAGQEDLEKELVGPPVKIAVGPDGKLTRAGESFCKTSGVPFEKTGRKVTPKGEVLCVKVTEKGRATAEILAEVIPAAIGAVKFKKSMRWADYDAAFVRPVRWVLAIFGGKVVDFKYGAVKSGDATWGLRKYGDPIHVNGFDSYERALSAQGIILDPVERRKFIEKGMESLVKTVGDHTELDFGLLDEVTNLVECPVPFLGTFDSEFLELPDRLLRVTMKHHQRYFPVLSAKSELLNYFIGISNTPVADQSVVTRGNERVLRARLKDAAFFFEEDKKKPLSSYVEKLKGVTFQAKLGSYFDKKERVKKVAVYLASTIPEESPNFSTADVERAADLCKADLVTGMVGEFPELQGYMGKIYAEHSGEKPDVARAIEAHYLPIGAQSFLPSVLTLVGTVLAIADKLDTIVGCFHAGLKPTGSSDPYALRRAALGIIRIVDDMRENARRVFELKSFDIDLEKALGVAVENYTSDQKAAETLRAEVNEFFKSRFKAWFLERARADVVDAFLDARDKITWMNDLIERFNAFLNFQAEPYFQDFATAFKRAQNITKGIKADLQPNPDLFTEQQENILYNKWRDVKLLTDTLRGGGHYMAAMETIGKEILGPMHEFFDKVFVEVDDAKVRENRKALLKQIVLLFSDFADFSRMEFRVAGKN